MTNLVEDKINTVPMGRITLADIESDLNTGNWDALYFVTEKQIDRLIETGRIDEDFSSRHQDYAEEMRCLIASA